MRQENLEKTTSALGDDGLQQVKAARAGGQDKDSMSVAKMAAQVRWPDVLETSVPLHTSQAAVQATGRCEKEKEQEDVAPSNSGDSRAGGKRQGANETNEEQRPAAGHGKEQLKQMKSACKGGGGVSDTEQNSRAGRTKKAPTILEKIMQQQLENMKQSQQNMREILQHSAVLSGATPTLSSADCSSAAEDVGPCVPGGVSVGRERASGEGHTHTHTYTHTHISACRTYPCCYQTWRYGVQKQYSEHRQPLE